MSPRFSHISHAGGKALCLLAFCLALLTLSVGNARSQENKNCGDAIYKYVKSAWNHSRIPGPGTCTPEIMSYLEFLVSIKDAGTDVEVLAKDNELKASADQGYISAKILYTLVYTNMFESKYLPELSYLTTYSRYVPYIMSMKFIGRGGDMQSFAAVQDAVTEAQAAGMIEANLAGFLLSAVQYKVHRQEVFQQNAVSYMLIVADFYALTDEVSDYLKATFTLDDARFAALKETAERYTEVIFANPNQRHCARDKTCVADSYLKHLICDIRNPRGDILVMLDQETCDSVSAPLVRQYRKRFRTFANYMAATNFTP